MHAYKYIPCFRASTYNYMNASTMSAVSMETAHTPSSRGPGTMPAGKGGNKTAKMVAKGEKKGGLTTGLAKASDALSKP